MNTIDNKTVHWINYQSILTFYVTQSPVDGRFNGWFFNPVKSFN